MTKLRTGGRLTYAQSMEKERQRAEQIKKINDQRKKEIDDKQHMQATQAKQYYDVKRSEVLAKQKETEARLLQEEAVRKAQRDQQAEEDAKQRYRNEHKKEFDDAEDDEILNELDMEHLDIDKNNIITKNEITEFF